MSEYSVEISPSALEDLRAIQTYIATELGSPIAAEKTVQRMLDVLKGLERLPLRNRALTTLDNGQELRRAKSDNFLALYTVINNTVYVLGIVYGKSDVERRISRLF